MGNIVGILE